MRALTPVTKRDARKLVAACANASNGFVAGTTSNSTGLPSFSAISTTWLKSSFS
jgi:hypothetical protein